MDVDANFYESVLRKFEKDDDVKVANIRVSQACKTGENFVSNVRRICIDGLKNANPYSISLFAKTRSNSLMAQKFHFDEMFQNEVDAYKYILPALRRHSKSKLFLPECLYVSDDLIILEDLSSSGHKSLSKGHRFSLNESLIVLKEFAKLHAASFILQEREPARVEELRKFVTEIYQSDRNDVLEKLMRAQVKLSAQLFEGSDSKNQSIISRLKNVEESGYKQICDTFMCSRRFSVFNQGDTWGNNILFGNDTVYFVDFQMMRFTSVAADLSFFLYINLRPSDRRENLDRLLQSYLEDLRMRCAENGVSKKLMAEITMEWLKSEMRDFRLFGFLSAIFVLPIFYFDSENLDVDKEVDYTDLTLISDEHKSALREYVLDFLNDL